MRDRRFIAAHRGGPLSKEKHRLLASWAADCAERVLARFEKICPADDRPRRAIEVARAWSRGEVPVGAAQKAAVAAHAAARSTTDPAAMAAARAAGHAVATAHMSEHSLGGALYAIKSLRAANSPTAAERAWQLKKLKAPIRSLVTTALNGDRFKSWRDSPPR